MVWRSADYTPASVFRRHSKIDDWTLIQLIYYFCNGISVPTVAKTLRLSRKTVRSHYLDLRARLIKPQFRRWHCVYDALGNVPDQTESLRTKCTLIEVMAVCHYSSCYKAYAKGNRKNRICRTCPLPHTFGHHSNAQNAIHAIDEISMFYRGLGIRGESMPDKLGIFFERFIHVSVMANVVEHGKRLPCGLLDPSDLDFQGGGTLFMALMDNLAKDDA